MTFWLSAAPTPARAKAQRLATQIEDEVTAQPSAPLCRSSAAIAKVMARRPPAGCVRDHRDDVDLDQPFGPRERADDEPGRDREHALEPAADGAVDRLAVARVGQIDGDLADVGEPGAGLAEQLLEVPHRLLGLTRRIAERDARAAGEILPDLAAHEHQRAARLDHLAEVVVEPLLGVGVAGVELAQPLVGHVRSPCPRPLECRGPLPCAASASAAHGCGSSSLPRLEPGQLGAPLRGCPAAPVEAGEAVALRDVDQLVAVFELGRNPGRLLASSAATGSVAITST